MAIGTNELSERRLSRDKGPAPLPPSNARQEIRGDVEITTKVDKKSSAMDIVKNNEKQATKFQVHQQHLEDQQEVVNGQNKLRRHSDTQNQATPEKAPTKNQEQPLRSKSVEDKTSASNMARQISVEEKRKSAPVKPDDSIENWRSSILDKESPFEDR
jgi:STE20-like kinase